MNREEFCKRHWEYYLILEKDFLETERYVSFDLGENNLYPDSEYDKIEKYGNSSTFSNEFVKQYLTICSEIDVIMKSICAELGSEVNNIKGYTQTILACNEMWRNIPNQIVTARNIKLQPFLNWSNEPYIPPAWWKPYNDIKHKRLNNFKKANLKNVINALAGLYMLEIYFVKYIGDRDSDMNVPNDISHLFKMEDFHTLDTVIGRDDYFVRIEEL